MKLLNLITRRQAVGGYLSVFLLPIIAGLLLLFLGAVAQQQALQKRWHLQSAADGMAISAATIMAREMNILSVLNRALIANQVAQAQLAGIASWFQHIKTSSQRLATVTSWIPYVNAVTAQLAKIVTVADQPLQALIQVGMTTQRLLIGAIEIAQVMVRFSFAQMIPESLAEIAKLQNISEHKWSLVHSPGIVPFPWLWWTFITPQSGVNDNRRLATLVMKSRDPFTRSRSYNWFKTGMIKAPKAGGSDLVISQTGQWSWHAVDTVSVHLNLLFLKQEIPWGSGAAFGGDKIARAADSQFGHSKKVNPTATRWALREQIKLSGVTTPRYFDRHDLESDSWPSIVVIFDDVVAKAGVRFSRPSSLLPRTDNKSEKANLYNALWESELQSLNTTEKLLITQFRSSSAYE